MVRIPCARSRSVGKAVQRDPTVEHVLEDPTAAPRTAPQFAPPVCRASNPVDRARCAARMARPSRCLLSQVRDAPKTARSWDDQRHEFLQERGATLNVWAAHICEMLERPRGSFDTAGLNRPIPFATSVQRFSKQKVGSSSFPGTASHSCLARSSRGTRALPGKRETGCKRGGRMPGFVQVSTPHVQAVRSGENPVPCLHTADCRSSRHAREVWRARRGLAD
jgi:hypothetical protein